MTEELARGRTRASKGGSPNAPASWRPSATCSTPSSGSRPRGWTRTTSTRRSIRCCEFCSQLGYDLAMISLVDRDAGVIRAERATGTMAGLVELTVRPLDGDDILAIVAREGSVVVVLIPRLDSAVRSGSDRCVGNPRPGRPAAGQRRGPGHASGGLARCRSIPTRLDLRRSRPWPTTPRGHSRGCGSSRRSAG